MTVPVPWFGDLVIRDSGPGLVSSNIVNIDKSIAEDYKEAFGNKTAEIY